MYAVFVTKIFNIMNHNLEQREKLSQMGFIKKAKNKPLQ